jgi:four helix bundle protein
MKFEYQDLEIWQLAIDFMKAMYLLLAKFPNDEKLDLVSQGKRAVVSIALNVAEGSGRRTDRDFSLFVNRTTTSLLEADAVLKIGLELGYVTSDDCATIDPLIEKRYFKLVAFDKSLRSGSNKRRTYSS